MNKPFKLLCLFLAFLLFGSAFPVSAEDGVNYYAKIVSVSALFDRCTEEVEFAVDFKGAVFENRSFSAVLSCLRLSGGVPGERVVLCEQSFTYGDCLVSPTRLEGRLKADGAVFSDETYGSFLLRIEGGKVESVGGVAYFALDGAECAVKPKPEPQGAFFTLGSDCAPKRSAKGGIIALSLFPTDINRFLSGGLRELSFTLVYDKALLLFRNADITGAQLTEASQTKNGLLIHLSSAAGLKNDREAVLKLYFRAEKAGEARFTVYGIRGEDAGGRLYTDTAGCALSAACRIGDKPFLPGDVNFDHFTDNMDSALILRYDAGLLDLIENGDVNSDGFTDNVDAALILLYDVGIISGFNT